MIRTGKLLEDPQGGVSAKRHLPKRCRETKWREVRLSVVEEPKEEQRLYGAILGSPEQVGKQMWALALLSRWGENTRVHGVGDGAPWIASQIAEMFAHQEYVWIAITCLSTCIRESMPWRRIGL